MASSSSVNPAGCIFSINWQNEYCLQNSLLRRQFGHHICWATSVVSCVEMCVKLKEGREVAYSCQEILDHYTPKDDAEFEEYEQHGRPQDAAEFIKVHGLAREEDVPFVGIRRNPPRTLYPRREKPLKDYLHVRNPIFKLIERHLKNQPIVARFEVEKSFLSETNGWKGIYSPPANVKLRGHGMVLTGSGTELRTGKKFWMCMNSNKRGADTGGTVLMLRDEKINPIIRIIVPVLYN